MTPSEWEDLVADCNFLFHADSAAVKDFQRTIVDALKGSDMRQDYYETATNFLCSRTPVSLQLTRRSSVRLSRASKRPM